MRMRDTVWLAAASLIAVAAIANPAMASKKTTVGTATVVGADGSVKGRLRLISDGAGVDIRLRVSGLAAGRHGVHLHTLGSCNAPDFASAGAHLNPQGHMHGALNPQGSHMGDLPNLEVGADGKGSLTARIVGTPAELWPILFDGDGTAIVVHAGADDYRTDPSGSSGARIACGVLTKS